MELTQYQKLAHCLIEARSSANKTQADVAKYLGVTYQAVSNWERAQSKIDSVSLLRLLLWLDVDIYDFLDRCGFEVMRKLNSTSPTLEKELLSTFYSLNKTGQEEACKRVSELSEISKYSRNVSSNPAKSTGTEG